HGAVVFASARAKAGAWVSFLALAGVEAAGGAPWAASKVTVPRGNGTAALGATSLTSAGKRRGKAGAVRSFGRPPGVRPAPIVPGLLSQMPSLVRMNTLSAPRTARARSGRPSPLKSPTASALE